MLKTIYSKYLVSFIVLLGIGFLSISIIICAVVMSYSTNTKTDLMNKTAGLVYMDISNEMTENGCGFIDAVNALEQKDSSNSFINGLSEYSESNIILIDSAGNILYHNCGKNLIKESKLPNKTVEDLSSGNIPPRFSDLDGFFESKRFNFVYPFEEEGRERSAT